MGMTSEDRQALDRYITREPPEDPYEDIDEAFLEGWSRLRDVIPTITRTTRSGKVQRVREVRMVFRQMKGQWFVAVGDVSDVGGTEAEALLKVVERLEAAR